MLLLMLHARIELLTDYFDYRPVSLSNVFTCCLLRFFSLFSAIIKLNLGRKFALCFDKSKNNEIKIGILWIANFDGNWEWDSEITTLVVEFEAICIRGARYFRRGDQTSDFFSAENFACS